ncbi:hypothetical protein KR200_010985, partial [Drosophila serrata]
KALVEILRRNLRPEIRHEILNIQTDSISRLREICRRRECFLEEVKRDQIYKKGSPFKNHVSELLDGEAVSLICWNCRKEGYRYQDCTAPRKDRRPYTTVVILNRRIKGLMDTGASMSCVGGQFAQEILASDVPIKRVFNNISTADGSKQSIVGSIRSNIEYNEVIKSIQDFWRAAETINAIRYKNMDRRPYAVQILGRLVLGLLDTGASMSAVGGNLVNQIIKQRMAFKRVATTVNTADGQQQKVVGRLKTPIQYEGKI